MISRAAVGPAGAGLVAEHERGAERVVVVAGQRLGPLAVDPQPKLGQEPGVAEEQAVGEPGQHVARAERDAERRALDEGDGAAVAAERGARRSNVHGCGTCESRYCRCVSGLKRPRRS